jgi:hypothetical protein
MSSHSVDWRNRWGGNWLTKIKDQNGCGSCYIFSAVGVVEAMLRIEHGMWSLRSEGDVGDAISMFFGAHGKCTGGTPAEVLDWIKANGVADPGCWPSLNTTQLGTPTPDRLGRTVKLDAYTSLSGADNMKAWIDANGPISASFSCYPEFHKACKNNSVYIYKNPQNQPAEGGHCIVIVGYDDSKKAWLVRNSWGTGWGTDGYGWFGYGQGEHGLEHFTSYGVLGSSTNPDPWTKRRLHSGNLYESGDGSYHRNFEVWAPGPGDVIRHYFQNGKTLKWSLEETLPEVTLSDNKKGYDCAGVPSVFGSTYFRNFEVTYQACASTENGTTTKQLRPCLYDQATKKWIDHGLFGPTDTDGVAGFIQINVGAPGNFEVVVRRSNGVLENWWRDNVSNAGKWQSKGSFGSDILLSGPALVQRWAANGDPGVGVPAGLDLVCVTKHHTMQRWWRDDPNNSWWVACETFGSNVKTPPVMIRSQFGATDETVPGNYELCVAVQGCIEHWWMPGNPEPGATAQWTFAETFGTTVVGRQVKQVLGLMESSYGNLELVAELDDGSLQHFSKDGSGWHARAIFGSVK